MTNYSHLQPVLDPKYTSNLRHATHHRIDESFAAPFADSAQSARGAHTVALMIVLIVTIIVQHAVAPVIRHGHHERCEELVAILELSLDLVPDRERVDAAKQRLRTWNWGRDKRRRSGCASPNFAVSPPRHWTQHPRLRSHSRL